MTSALHTEERGISSTENFCSILKRVGINLVSGVPCGVQKKIISYFVNDPTIPYIPASREEDAIGIGAGAFLAGKNPLILMQNSGLANSLNSITSLLIAYRIPILMLVTWRGCPDWRNENVPHHLPLGKVTPQMLKIIGIHFEIIRTERPNIAVESSMKYIKNTSKPAVLLLKRYILD